MEHFFCPLRLAPDHNVHIICHLQEFHPFQAKPDSPGHTDEISVSVICNFFVIVWIWILINILLQFISILIFYCNKRNFINFQSFLKPDFHFISEYMAVSRRIRIDSDFFHFFPGQLCYRQISRHQILLADADLRKRHCSGLQSVFKPSCHIVFFFNLKIVCPIWHKYFRLSVFIGFDRETFLLTADQYCGVRNSFQCERIHNL